MTRLAWITGLLIFPSPLLFADDAKIDPFFTPRPELRAAAKDDPQHSPNFFRLRGRDFKNLVTSKENFVILGVGLGGAWGARP